MDDIIEIPSDEEIARHYSAMMDSVAVITSIMPTQDTDDLDTIQRNLSHLEIMLARNWWSGYDLTPIKTAIAGAR